MYDNVQLNRVSKMVVIFVTFREGTLHFLSFRLLDTTLASDTIIKVQMQGVCNNHNNKRGQVWAEFFPLRHFTQGGSARGDYSIDNGSSPNKYSTMGCITAREQKIM